MLHLRCLQNPLEAEKIYRTAIKYRPRYYDAFFNLGVVMSEGRRFKDAKKWYKKALNVRPNSIGPLNNLADAYLNLNKPDSAILYFSKVTELNPNNASAVNRIGTIYGQALQDYPNAIKYLKKAYEIQPNVLKFHEDLGVAYGFAGQFDKALQVFETIIKSNPNYASAYFNMSVTLSQLGRSAEAQQYLQKAAELDPKYRGAGI